MNDSDAPGRSDPKTLDEPTRPAAAGECGAAGQDQLQAAFSGRDAQYRTLFELLPGSVVLLDSQGFVREANRFFCQHIGYTRDELIGMHVTKFSKERPEFIEQNIRRMLAGEVLEHEITNVQKDGSPRFYELREAAITLPDGSKGILAVSNDITDRKRAEQSKLDMERQLLQLQKLESLGVLAGGIAHDFNNLLAAMLGNVELAMMDVPEDSSAHKSLKTALAAGHRAARLTSQMLDYSGRGRLEITQVNLSELVWDLAELFKVSISKSADLELHLIEDLPIVQADANQLQQVVMNLITNASEAIGDLPGRITISTNICECDSAYLAESRLAVKPQPGPFVYLEVSDTGCGMDESVQQKLFDPFFTTKFVGRGLGMSGVLGVIQGHNGAIMVSSEPGKGTSVRILLPLRPAQQTDTQILKALPVHPISAIPMLSGTVLVAEDEPQLRTFAENLLKRMGLHVVSVADGEQAVLLFKQHAEEITFVLLDLTMPKLDGLKTLAEIRQLRPGVKAVLTSGYDGADITWRHEGQGFDAFIQKPYKLEELTKLVRLMCAPAS